MAIHSSILAWRISWTEEPDGLQSMGSQGAGHLKVSFLARTPIVVVELLSHVCLFVTLWTVACQAPLSTGFPRQDY